MIEPKHITDAYLRIFKGTFNFFKRCGIKTKIKHKAVKICN